MGVGFGVAPVALGWVADGVGPHLAFLLLPAFIAAAALLAARLGRALRPAPAELRSPTPVDAERLAPLEYSGGPWFLRRTLRPPWILRLPGGPLGPAGSW